MIVVKNPSWMRMVFTLRGCSLNKTWPRIVTVTGFAIFITALEAWLDESHALQIPSITTTPFSLIGLALAIFLGFRNNAAYDRFWEGRKLWGRMVNVSRSFTRQVLTLIDSSDPGDQEDVTALKKDLVYRMIGYVHAFRHHLRGSTPWDDVSRTISEEECKQLEKHDNQPTAIVMTMGERIQQARRNNWIHNYHVPVLEESLTEITGVQGGCERIKATPIPFTYSVLIHRIVALYCFLLPFGLVHSINVLTPVVVAFVSYAFFGLDDIGDEIEQPFDQEPNDLPLDAICTNIEINLRQALGEENVPKQKQPICEVLV